VRNRRVHDVGGRALSHSRRGLPGGSAVAAGLDRRLLLPSGPRRLHHGRRDPDRSRQLGKLVGLSSDQDNAVIAASDIVAHLGQANAASVALAIVSLLLLIGLRHFLPRFPAALLVVVLGIVASWSLDLASHGVNIAGPIPPGLPTFAFPRVGGHELAQLAGSRAASSSSASPTRY
jgi:hypothetical protein